MGLIEILVMLRARWKLAVLVWVAVVALVAVVVVVKQPRYTGAAMVVLDVKTPDPIVGVSLAGGTGNSYMATQLGVLRSDRVAIRVAEALGWDKDKEKRDAWLAASGGQGDFKAALAGGLLRDLDAAPVKETSVITVSYTSPDPVLAAQIANAWVKAYIDITLELRVEPARQYAGFFDARGKQLREDLERAQSALSEFQQKNGLVATDERLDVENARLMELSTQMVALQGLVNEIGGRERESGTNPDKMTEVLSNPVIIGMTSELARQEARQKELGARQGDQHPEMIELNAKIAELRSSISNETKRVTASIAVNSSAVQARLAQASAAVDEQRNKLLRLKSLRDEAGVLQRDVENARRVYDTIMTRASQTSVESQTTQTNVSVLRQADAPLRPSEPRVVLYMAVAVLAATFLALAAALGSEMRDRRLRSTQDVLRTLRLPLLGVLPERSGRLRRRLGKRRHWPAQIAGSSSQGKG